MDELIKLYQEYINVLSESEASMAGLAIAHGYVVPERLIKRGEELREKIAKLTAECVAG